MHKIEVFFEKEENDAESLSVKNDIVFDLEIKVDSVKLVKCYYINADFSREELQKTAEKLFSDPIVQKYSIDSETGIKGKWLIEVKLHPGVTDNEGNAAMIGVKDLLEKDFKENEWIRTSKKYFISGEIKEKEAQRICSELLANTVIESTEIKKLSE